MSTDSSADDRQPDPTPTLSRRQQWLYSTGDLTTAAPLALVSFFQLFFMTDVARLSPAIAALPILLGKLWDAFNDPIVGILADRVRSKMGRRRILLAAGAAPVGLSFALMWLVPPLGTTGLVVFYTITYIVFDTTFTVVHIAYNSLTPEVTSNYDEQSSLHGIRMFFNIAGSLLAVIIGTVLQWFFEDLGAVFFYLGLVVGALIIIPPLIVIRVTKDIDREAARQIQRPAASIRHVLSNRPFWVLVGIYITSWTAVSLIAADLVFFARYYLQVPEQANYFVLIAQGVALAFIPLAVWIARKWDKRTAIFVGFASMIPILVMIGMSRPGNVAPVYVMAVLLAFGIAVAYVTPWSMIPETIAWGARKDGTRNEASYYAVLSFLQKSGTAAGVWIMAQILERTGYVNPTAEVQIPVQPESALTAIRHLISTVPSILLLVSLVFTVFYPISRAVHARVDQELANEGAD